MVRSIWEYPSRDSAIDDLGLQGFVAAVTGERVIPRSAGARGSEKAAEAWPAPRALHERPRPREQGPTADPPNRH